MDERIAGPAQQTGDGQVFSVYSICVICSIVIIHGEFDTSSVQQEIRDDIDSGIWTEDHL